MRNYIKSYRTIATLVLVFAWSSGEARAQLTFSDVTTAKGLGDYRATSGDIHSPGGIFTDLNNDGYPDLYLIRNDGDSDKFNQLYLNVPDGGSGRTFDLQTNALGARNELSGGTLTNYVGATGAIAADYDNDGDTDLYVTNFGGTDRLYQNQLSDSGTLSFIDVTGTAGVGGLGGSPHSLSAAWSDPDRDGDLDLYVGVHNQWGQPFTGERDTFYRNNGDGTFTDVTGTAGPLPGSTLGPTGFENSTGGNSVPGQQTYSDTNGVIFADFNNDQWPDLLVTNKSGKVGDADMLYINQGNDTNGDWQGYKTETYNLPVLAGNISRSAMGVNVGDIDNDGDLDIYISDNPGYDASGVNDLLINQLAETGTLGFVNRDVDAGLSWGVQIEDFDNNGNVEIHVTNDPLGNAPGDEALFQFVDPSDPLSSVINNVASSAGTLNAGTNGRGSLAADYNRDGKLDLFVVNLNNDPRFTFTDDPSVLFENTTTGGGGFLSLKLIGDPTNPNGNLVSTVDAIGARVIVTADIDGDGIDEQLIRDVISGSSNAASTSSLALEFGLGQATLVDVEIWWPDGRTTLLQDVAVDQFLTITAVVPEPSTAVLLTFGMATTAFGRRRKFRSTHKKSYAR